MIRTCLKLCLSMFRPCVNMFGLYLNLVCGREGTFSGWMRPKKATSGGWVGGQMASGGCIGFGGYTGSKRGRRSGVCASPLAF